MRRPPIGLVAFLLVTAMARADQPSAKVPPAETLEAVRGEYTAATKKFIQEFRTAYEEAKKKGKEAEKAFRFDKPFPGAEFSPRFLAIAERAPEGPEAIEALKLTIQTASNPAGSPLETQAKAFKILGDHYSTKPEIKPFVRTVVNANDQNSRELVEQIIARNPDRKIQALAYSSMVKRCERSIAMVGKLKGDEKRMKQVEANMSKERLDKMIADYERDKAEIDGLRKVLRDKYADLLIDLSVGQPAPELVSHDIGGKTVRLSELKGKVVVLDFWATWCGPCKAMIPHEREMVERLKDKPFQLVSISADDEKKTLTDFLAKEKMPWTHWWDGGPQAKLFEDWNIDHFPTIFVLDSKGVIRHTELRGEKLEKAVNELLKEAEPKKVG